MFHSPLSSPVPSQPLDEAQNRLRARDGATTSTARVELTEKARAIMVIDLSGKNAVVSGSTSGIGFAIARGLAAAGAGVVVSGRSQKSVDAALSRLAAALPNAISRVR